MFVPSGWWHAVLNLEESIAITQNYVSTANLSQVLKFLRDSPFAVSGVAEEERKYSLFKEFCDVLEQHEPDLYREAIAELTELDEISLESKRKKEKVSTNDGEKGFRFQFAVAE
jgi:hypothetical protein